MGQIHCKPPPSFRPTPPTATTHSNTLTPSSHRGMQHNKPTHSQTHGHIKDGYNNNVDRQQTLIETVLCDSC